MGSVDLAGAPSRHDIILTLVLTGPHLVPSLVSRRLRLESSVPHQSPYL